MSTLKTAVAVAWIVFWIYWIASAFRAEQGTGGRRAFRFPGLSVVAIVLLLRVFRDGNSGVTSPVLGAVGAAMFVAGIAIAIWARIHLGTNWGMPTTQKADPELVTTGPYERVRHPIYSGLLLAMLGTALVTSLFGLIIVAVLGAYFIYSASIEEQNLAATFPATYPAYKARTQMLIPFVL